MLAFIEKIYQNLEVIDFARKNTDKLLMFLFDEKNIMTPNSCIFRIVV